MSLWQRRWVTLGLWVSLLLAGPGHGANDQVAPVAAQPRAQPASIALERAWVGSAAGADAGEVGQTVPLRDPVVERVFRQAQQWLSDGEDEPERVMGLLANASRPAAVPEGVWGRLVFRVYGLVAARSGLPEGVQKALSELRVLAIRTPDALNRGDQALIQAVSAEQRGQYDSVAHLAAEADAAYGSACTAGAQVRWCDYRAWWWALHLRIAQEDRQGKPVDMRLREHERDLAKLAHDNVLLVRSLTMMAVSAQRIRETEMARQYLHEAHRAAREGEASIVAQVYAKVGEALVLRLQQAFPAARQMLEMALWQAREAGSARLEALVQTNLSDVHMQTRQYALALDAVLKALPVVERHNDLPTHAVLLHNAGLVRLKLRKQRDVAYADLERALKLWQQAGAKATMAEALMERSEVLEEMGDARQALEFFHRADVMKREIEKAARDEMVRQMRASLETENQRHALKRLEEEKKLRQQSLDNQSRQLRVMALTASVLALVLVLAVLLALRMRDTNRRLRRSEAMLRMQSERDALTGLANRRHFRDVLLSEGGVSHFRGAILLLDIDHFKRINDQYGHAVGDVVLMEVARRVSSVVRGVDLVCRWGGEEFLVYAHALSGEGLDLLAQRILHVVGDAPVLLPEGNELAVTTSLGYACFPMPHHHLLFDWAKAVNLVDMALYTAKSLGRDRAVGLRAIPADSAATLERLERDFEQMRLSGAIELNVMPRLKNSPES